MRVGERLRQLREARGINQEDLARLLGLTRATVSRYENGDQQIRADELPGIADKLGVHPAEFFLEPGEYVARITVPPLLAVGDYAAGIWIGSAYETHVYEEDALRFRLEGATKGRADRVLQLGLVWEVERTGDLLATGERA